MRGIATAHGSATAHAAILARALGLPAAVGLGDALLAIDEGTRAAARRRGRDAPGRPATSSCSRDAEERGERLAARRAAARERAHEPGATRDGARVEVFANLGSAAEAATAVELGAEGVGLLRTEFLFLDRPQLPDEDEQAETLRRDRRARSTAGRSSCARSTPAPTSRCRRCPCRPRPTRSSACAASASTLERPEILATQLRAILRVAAEHPVKAMLPMVATLGEVRAARALLDEARAATGIDAPLELGIMVEVPAAALTAAHLAAHVDFFSLGTNDLTQYTMAAERGDERLAGLLAGPQPAVLRLVQGDRRGGGGPRALGRACAASSPATPPRPSCWPASASRELSMAPAARAGGQGGAARGRSRRRARGGATPRSTPRTPMRRADSPPPCSDVASRPWRPAP